MLCTSCKQVELTPQEERTELQKCMFCWMELEDAANEAFDGEGAPIVYVENPEAFGRTRKDYDDFKLLKIDPTKQLLDRKEAIEAKDMPAVGSMEDQLREVLMKATETQSEINDGTPKQTPKDIANMAALLNQFNSNKPPTTLTVQGSEDFSLSLTLPGHVSEPILRTIYEMMKAHFRSYIPVAYGKDITPFLKDGSEPKSFILPTGE